MNIPFIGFSDKLRITTAKSQYELYLVVDNLTATCRVSPMGKGKESYFAVAERVRPVSDEAAEFIICAHERMMKLEEYRCLDSKK